MDEEEIMVPMDEGNSLDRSRYAINYNMQIFLTPHHHDVPGHKIPFRQIPASEKKAL